MSKAKKALIAALMAVLAVTTVGVAETGFAGAASANDHLCC
jgi:hypothetical protein